MADISRTYVAPINISSAFTAQIDIFELIPVSTGATALYGFEISQTSEVGDAQEEQLTLLLKSATSATTGSGGGTSTFRATNSGMGTTAGTSLKTGNTTKLTGGTQLELARWSWNVRQSLLYVPVPEERIVTNKTLVLELLTTPADSIAGIQGRISIGEWP